MKFATFAALALSSCAAVTGATADDVASAGSQTQYCRISVPSPYDSAKLQTQPCSPYYEGLVAQGTWVQNQMTTYGPACQTTFAYVQYTDYYGNVHGGYVPTYYLNCNQPAPAMVESAPTDTAQGSHPAAAPESL